MPERLTEKEAETLTVTIALKEKHGYPPTLREVAKKMNVSGTLIQLRFRTLIHKGYITRRPGESRAVRILYDPNGSPYTN